MVRAIGTCIYLYKEATNLSFYSYKDTCIVPRHCHLGQAGSRLKLPGFEADRVAKESSHPWLAKTGHATPCQERARASQPPPGIAYSNPRLPSSSFPLPPHTTSTSCYAKTIYQPLLRPWMPQMEYKGFRGILPTRPHSEAEKADTRNDRLGPVTGSDHRRSRQTWHPQKASEGRVPSWELQGMESPLFLRGLNRWRG